MGKGANRNKLCYCGSGKKAKYCCFAKSEPKPSGLNSKKISSEGTSSPQVARLLNGLFEVVEHTTLTKDKKNLIKTKLMDLHKVLVGSKTQLFRLRKELKSIDESLKVTPTVFDGAGNPQNIPKTQYLSRAIEFLYEIEEGLKIIREILGCIHDRFFTDPRFLDFKTELQSKFPSEHTLNKLMKIDRQWILSFQDLVDKARQGEEVVKDYNAKIENNLSHVTRPFYITGDDVEKFIDVYQYNLFTFCEEMVVLSLENVVHEKLAIHEIPEGARNKEMPLRFRIGLKQGVSIEDLKDIKELQHIYRSGYQLYHMREQVRVAKYGHAGSTIHGHYQGKEFVAVGNTIHFSTKWKTFVDFLHDFIKVTFGEPWWKGQVALPFEKRSPVLQLAERAYHHQKNMHKKKGEYYGVDPNGPTHAYLSLAYELYILAKHGALRPRLLHRLKINSEFPGARYEVFVAATCIKAGFKIKFIDDTDGSSRHPEFSAQHFMLDREFVVEAKRMNRTKVPDDQESIKLNLKSNLKDAFDKFDGRPYIIFMELDLPPIVGNPFNKPWTQELFNSATEADGRDHNTGKDLFNMIVYTNRPTGDDTNRFPEHTHIGMVSMVPKMPLSHNVPLQVLADTLNKVNFIPSWLEE